MRVRAFVALLPGAFLPGALLFVGTLARQAWRGADYVEEIRHDKPIAYWRFADELCARRRGGERRRPRRPNIAAACNWCRACPALAGKRPHFKRPAPRLGAAAPSDSTATSLSVEFWFT